jgi:hypothetical protein
MPRRPLFCVEWFWGKNQFFLIGVPVIDLNFIKTVVRSNLRRTRMEIRKILKWKNLLSVLIIVLIPSVMLELISPYFYKSIYKTPFNKKEIQKRLHKSQQNTQPVDMMKGKLPDWVNFKDIHPYVGFTNQLTEKNNFGFSSLNPLMKKSPEKLIVCILGGSFADGMYTQSGEDLKQYLRDYPLFAGRDIVLISLANGGYKQPQQLFALSFFLFLGAEYDIVINVDGFNEIALPYIENIPHKVFQYFPRSWYLYSAKSLDIPAVLKIAEIYNLRLKQEKLKRIFASFPFYSSKFFLLVWDTLDIRVENNIRFASLELSEIIAQKNYQNFGAYAPSYTDKRQLLGDLAKYWRNASEQINNLAGPNEFSYFHFLQPNQYVHGSKVFSQAEKKTAYAEGDFLYKEPVENGYVLLQEEGRNLIRKNLNFTDLSMIFRGEPRSVYIDTCCHLNKLGYDIVAKEISRQIFHYFNRLSAAEINRVLPKSNIH